MESSKPHPAEQAENNDWNRQQAEQESIGDGGPAYARSAAWSPSGTSASKSQEGATLRDYFAARAPAEIPNWFMWHGQMPVPAVPQVPSVIQALRTAPGFSVLEDIEATEDREEQIGEAYICVDTGGEPRPELAEIVKFARDMIASAEQAAASARAAARQIEAENEAMRYFAWRWHYANQMLRARGN